MGEIFFVPSKFTLQFIGEYRDGVPTVQRVKKPCTKIENDSWDIHDDDYTGRQSATGTEYEYIRNTGNDFGEREKEKKGSQLANYHQ